jgi:hypothetical protein
MPTFDNSRRLTVLVENAPTKTLHLFVGSSERGMRSFACEQAPLTTLQNYGLPSRCPVCGVQNPLGGKANDNQQR